jgi:hypothetical protein
MTQLFRKKNNCCPIPEETRKWFDLAFLWFFDSFGKEKIETKRVLVPDYTDFPVKYTGGHDSAEETLKIVAHQMEICIDEINLEFYQEGVTEISAGGAFGSSFYLQNDERDKFSAGLYYGKFEDGKYHILLEQKKLKSPEGMVATLAHELSHVKLLGEGRIKDNNERLTDLTTVVFGLGIFNANVAFVYNNNYGSWGFSNTGYLSQSEWGYALALLAYIKNDCKPLWLKYLSKDISVAFNKSIGFILNNTGIVLNVDYASKKEQNSASGM